MNSCSFDSQRFKLKVAIPVTVYSHLATYKYTIELKHMLGHM